MEIAGTCTECSLMIWFQQIEEQLKDKTPRVRILANMPLLHGATAFLADTFADSVRLAANYISISKTAFRLQEDCMAFGKPVKYWQLDSSLVYASGPNPWDTAVNEASEEYKHRMHNLCCDNCHSHVAMAMNLMKYNNTSWNMVKLCLYSLLYGRYVSIGGFLKTWVPFFLLVGASLTVILTLHLR
ncbi:unnamed protein product [Ranitomeya imitator]|uniref:Transmembrane protein 222 n=1 Tax=Ranitomeya imitator TaxID=111125 RepID=A0ABN9LAK2_9NEOB|nr:unnamed protein product [Ranitomeya imitator]